MKIFKTILFFFFGLLHLAVSGSTIEFKASAPEQVAVGEGFRLVFSLNARPSDFQPPSFDGFRVVSGPSQSSSSSTQIINNQVTTTISFSYSYILEATREGILKIPGAITTVDGEQYTSNPLEIRVEGQTDPSASPGRPREQTLRPEGPAADDLFVRVQASNTSPYQSEQVILSYKIYTRVPVTQFSIERLPSFQGLWTENITPSGQPSASTEVIDGVSYNVAEIRRMAIFPQRSGKIILEPLEVECLVRVRGQQRRGGLFEEFFGSSPFGSFETVEKTIRSNRLELEVKPLPSQNRPADFKGMVGDFDLGATLEPAELAINDAANLVVTVQGKGNMRMLEKPRVQLPPNLEAFDPNISDNIRSGRNGISGSRTFDFLLIPRTGGEFEIPPITMSFFDPAKETYVSRRAGPFTLKVSGETPSIAGTPGVLAQEDAQYLSRDIRFIYTRPFELQPIGFMFYKSTLFYVLFILPLALFVLLLIFWRRQIRLQRDTALMKNKRAQKLAKKRLRKAGSLLKDKEESLFYEEIFRTLWGYISDKLNMPVSNLNKANVASAFKKQKVRDELAAEFLKALDDCEYARFAPGSAEMRMEETFEKAYNTIVTIEKELRNNKTNKGVRKKQQ